MSSTPSSGARSRAGAALAAALAGALMLAPPAPAWAQEGDPSWRPAASERLVKLPARYLKKSLEHDFAQSELGLALRDLDTEIGFKSLTLGDLQAAIVVADGELRTELRHQFLGEKRAYIDMAARKLELRRKHLETRERLFERVLDKLGRDKASMTPARIRLVAQQEQARERFRASISKVDMALLRTSAAPESRYAREYAKNLTAIETLVRAIEGHPMTASAEVDGIAMTKRDYIHQMMAETQAGLALLDQEETVLGYMAKLVALDALGLSEEVMDAELADSDVPETGGLISAVGYFVEN